MSFDKSPRGYRRIGLMGAGALALVAALIMALTLFPFGQDTYTAELEHTPGLRVGEAVPVAGVGVGEVRKIEIAGDRQSVGKGESVSVRVALGGGRIDKKKTS